MKTRLDRRDFLQVIGLAGGAVISLLSATALGRAETTKIGVSIPTLQNPFWVNAVKFAQHAAKELDVELTVVGADNREDKQLTDVQSLLSCRRASARRDAAIHGKRAGTHQARRPRPCADRDRRSLSGLRAEERGRALRRLHRSE